MKSFVGFFQSLVLSLLKGWIVLALRVYFRKAKVEGLENIPRNKPILFAPNHQYAFMDALIVTRFSGKIPYFLVRADFFESPVSGFLLRALRMMPVYRTREKVDMMEKNEEIFDKCVEILENRDRLIIFPEGNHSKIRRIRIIKKGIFRIAFKAINEEPDSKDLVIIPVGINYDDQSKFQSDYYLRFGKPITVNDYNEGYQENQARSMETLKDLISKQLADLTIHIDNAESYKFYENMLKVYSRPYCIEKNYKFRKLDIRFKAYREIIEGLDSIKEMNPIEFKDIQPKFNRFHNLLRKNKINPMALEKVKENPWQRTYKAIILISLWPFYFYGLINNLLGAIIPAFLSIKAVSDDHFLSSVQLGIGLLSFPISYFLQSWIVFKLTGSPFYTFLYVISIILFGLFSQKYRYQYKKTFEILKFRRLLIKRKKDYRTILKTYREVIDFMNNQLIREKVPETV
ncbi:1-acyl-sn-glycerol-3-phosphate acyltransferase [Bacteroidota bacterium]